MAGGKAMKHRFPKAAPEYELHVAIRDMPSEVYHSIQGTYSSSQLKDLLADEDGEVFYKKHIGKTIEKLSIPAFDVGTYFHSGVLEPHKLKDDCVVYPGKTRHGRQWEEFKLKHKNKAIVTEKQKSEAVDLVRDVKNSPIAIGYIERGEPEVSFFAQIYVYEGEIYAPLYDLILTPGGWESGRMPADKKKAQEFVIKVRADSLGDDFVLDLKSTTGNARSSNSMRRKISDYQYELSAALYLDMFSLLKETQLELFIWTFASKDFKNCKSYRASETNIRVGRAKYMTALNRLAVLTKNKWQLYDSLGVLEPEAYQLEIIREKELDL